MIGECIPPSALLAITDTLVRVVLVGRDRLSDAWTPIPPLVEEACREAAAELRRAGVRSAVRVRREDCVTGGAAFSVHGHRGYWR